MGILDQDCIQGFIRMADDGFQQGWHERNGGNLSYRLKPEEAAAMQPFFNKQNDFLPLEISAKNLAGDYFVVTGTGKFFRNIALNPEGNLCIAEINAEGNAYRIVWGLSAGGFPTSEWPTHLMNHSIKKTVTNDQHRVIYHAHSPAIIALTFLLPLDDKTFSLALWQMITECPVIFPDGIGVVPWMVPGGPEIALITCELMKKYNVAVWAHHGMFCSGEDFDSTFGLMHTVEKAADIYLRIISAGEIRQKISSQNLRDTAKHYGVTLREEFLD